MEKIALIGAASAQFGLGMVGDILRSRILEGCTICLHDIDGQALSGIERRIRAYTDARGLRYRVTSATSRTEALRGATFCIISIEVGERFELWEQDWRIPRAYGIRQVYGENGGPGGLFHALRVIPPILEICGDIRRLCPDATVLNYSNPMSRICTTVHRAFPGLRFVGLCHEIKSLFRHLPLILQTPLENIVFRAGGLNHFSFLLEVRYRDSGADTYPKLRRTAPGYFAGLHRREDLFEELRETRAGPGAEPVLRGDTREWAERGLFRVLLERFGYLPITTDSHLGEYIPWAHETVDHRGIWGFYRWYRGYCLEQRAGGGDFDPLGRQGPSERGVAVIEGILTDSGLEEPAVNIPNRAPQGGDGKGAGAGREARLIADLPPDLAVEVPAVLTGRGVLGVRLGALPRGIAGLLVNQAAVHDLTAEAVLHRSRELALQALLVDPVVDSLSAAERTLDAMLELQRPYLGYLK